MRREAAISCVIHLLIFAIMIVSPKNREIPLEMTGEQISINMVSVPRGSAREDAAEKRSPDKKKTEKARERSEPGKRAEAERVKPVEKPVEVRVEKPAEKPVKKAAAAEEALPEPEKTAEEPEPAEVQVAAAAPEAENSPAENPGAEQDGAQAAQKAGEAGGSETQDENLVKLTDGSYSVKHQGVDGLSYGFISKPDPAYPAVARRMGLKEEVRVRVVMQFDSEGKLESVKFVDEEDRFGFANEVKKVVGMWRLTPIEYKGQLIKMRYYWTFKFEVPR